MFSIDNSVQVLYNSVLADEMDGTKAQVSYLPVWVGFVHEYLIKLYVMWRL